MPAVVRRKEEGNVTPRSLLTSMHPQYIPLVFTTSMHQQLSKKKKKKKKSFEKEKVNKRRKGVVFTKLRLCTVSRISRQPEKDHDRKSKKKNKKK